MHVLFVCTGNLCRSALAERLFTARARSHADGNVVLEVGSAGTAAALGRAMHPHSVEALTELGGDPGNFRSRQLTSEMLRSADLVLTMTRAHRRTALELDARGLRRTFTLSEAAGLAQVAAVEDLRSARPDLRAGMLAARLDGARSLRPGSDADDIPDPVEQPLRVHRSVAARITAELDVLAAVLLPASDGRAYDATQKSAQRSSAE